MKIMRLARVLACVASVAGLSACATITRGTSQAWTVETEPNGASVQTTNGFHCEATPCSFRMERRSEFDATITKPGYRTVTSHVSHGIGAGGAVGMAGNAVLGGIIGGAVDVSSGAMMDIHPNPLHVVLEAVPPGMENTPAPPPPAPPPPAPPPPPAAAH